VVYVNVPRRADDAPSTAEQEWQVVERIGAWTLDVVFCNLVQLCERTTIARSMYSTANPHPEMRMTAATILRNKGICRRGQERRALFARIDREMRDLGCLMYELTWPVPVPNASTVPQWLGDRQRQRFGIQKLLNDQLFRITIEEQWQLSLNGGPPELMAVVWKVEPGDWAKFWFNADSKKQWIMNCARTLLTLDHRDGPQLLAKKIGFILTVWPTAAHGKTIQVFVQTLLNYIGEMPASGNRYGRLRDRLESALELLVKRGFMRWEWADELDDNADRSKGWVQRWLHRKMCITLLSSTAVIDISTVARHKRKRRKSTIRGVDLRRARAECGWSQQRLARYLGITPACLSYIEQGRRGISPRVLEKIRALGWFESAKLDLHAVES
jgi:DNA-binding XRE family transcriptional regulator